jgi:hypothetical protein
MDHDSDSLPSVVASNLNDISVRTVCCFYIDLNNDGLDATELSKKYGLHGEAYTLLLKVQ